MSCETTPCGPESAVSDARRRVPNLNLDPDAPRIQGIDYVDVLDFAAPAPEPPEAGSLRCRILLVHCFASAADLDDSNLRIGGALGSAPPAIAWAYAGSRFFEQGFPESLRVVVDQQGRERELSADEIELFKDQGDQVLVVHIVPQIDPAEDLATYTLTFAASDGSTGGGIDPRLATHDFVLNAEGPVAFDCAPPRRLARVPQPPPPIDYLAKDYASFRRLMLDRMAVVMPEWSERNAADMGVALVELLAYVGDQLSYYQDASATESYLGTARRRISVRRHARLLDYMLHEGNNARVWVCLEVNAYFEPVIAPDALPDDPGISPQIPAGMHLITRLPNEDQAVLDDERLSDALQEDALFFETMHAIRPRPSRNQIALYDWGGGVACLARGATRATLDGTLAELGLQVGDVLILEEIDEQPGASASASLADPGHRHAVCLTQVRKVEDVLAGREVFEGVLSPPREVVEVTWHEEEALPFVLPLRYPSGALAAVARGNVVLADHGRTMDREPLEPAVAPAGEHYRPALRGAHVTHRAPLDPLPMRKQPASARMAQEPRRAVPQAVVLEVDEEERVLPTPWYPRRDLLASGPFDRHVVIEMEQDGSARVRFGDGVNGRSPSAGSHWQATYRVGNGSAGNVGADAIAHVMVPMDGSDTTSLILGGVDAVRNPLPAVGGTDPERVEQVRLYAPNAFRLGERAVTADDYAEISERHPEVQKAMAEIRWTGSWNTVFVTVDRRGGLPLDLAFEAELRTYLEPYRMAGQDIEFEPPRFVPLEIAFTIHVAPGYLQSEVNAALLEVLGSGESADGTRGLFHPDNFTFGDPVYLSHLVAAAMKVPGVAWVDFDDRPPKPNRFQRFGQDSRGELGEGRITTAPLEIIRVDNDPTAPQNGRIQLYMEGGL